MSFQLEEFDGAAVTDEIIAAAAKFFSENYGIWGPKAAEKMGKQLLKRGARIQMSPTNLVRQILPLNGENKYVRVTRDGELVGNVFGTRWIFRGKMIMWVTQLCVKSGYRCQGIAKTMLEALREHHCVAIGVLSSHAHAILAVAHVYGSSPADIDLGMTRDYGREIMDSCPVPYVRNATIHGKLFGEVGDGSVSCADTHFWVDHEEPLKAVDAVRRKGTAWPFGELPDGHEFLIVIHADGREGLLDDNIVTSQR